MPVSDDWTEESNSSPSQENNDSNSPAQDFEQLRKSKSNSSDSESSKEKKKKKKMFMKRQISEEDFNEACTGEKSREEVVKEIEKLAAPIEKEKPS